jgi:hypothetical protein
MLMDELPRTPSGKVRKDVLRASRSGGERLDRLPMATVCVHITLICTICFYFGAFFYGKSPSA